MQCFQAHRAKGQEGDGRTRQVRQRFRHLGHRLGCPLRHSHRNRIVPLFSVEEAIDGQHQVGNAQFTQFATGPIGFPKRCSFRAADQDNGRLTGVGETLNSRRIEGFLFLQTGQWAKAGGTTGRGRNEFVPGRWQG